MVDKMVNASGVNGTTCCDMADMLKCNDETVNGPIEAVANLVTVSGQCCIIARSDGAITKVEVAKTGEKLVKNGEL